MGTLDAIDRIGVIGAGTMGHGIAQVAAVEGYEVVLRDVDRDIVDRGLGNVESSLDRFVEKGELDREAADAARERITGTTDLADFADVDFVVEAIVEKMEIKRDVFAELDGVVPADAVLASNTSTLSITSIASATERPGKVVGLHFMNPVPLMEGVELVVGEKTDPETVELAHDLAESLGKTTWESDDKPGFVTNRILMPWLAEGIRAFDEGVASKGDIDAGMTLGTNVPMGPLTLADHIGLDICLDAMETLHEELGDRYQPPYLLKRKVEAGDLGKKTGRGFYDYEG
ncbi:MAG: 3-hydroxyacyl-CoA dehydrogenase family protein [Haloarculaceae archaeon]